MAMSAPLPSVHEAAAGVKRSKIEQQLVAYEKKHNVRQPACVQTDHA